MIRVLCHGVFDVLHLGHKRHLEAARRLGDDLTVSLTADEFVEKGPDRPMFTAAQRAEMLRALSCVDEVIVTHSADAVSAIEIVQPAIYVKGADYAGGDPSGRLDREREAIEKIGGRIEFTDDITFSSSALINRHLSPHDPELADYLTQARDTDMLARSLEALEAITDQHVMLVGETIIDEYRYASLLGMAGKEPIPACKLRTTERFMGGIEAAAAHLRHFVRKVDVVTGAPITKARYVDPGHLRKLFEVYEGGEARLRDEAKILKQLRNMPRTVIAIDFGHGMMTKPIRDQLTKAEFLAVSAQTNAGNRGFNLVTKYSEPAYLCCDEPEARMAARDAVSPLDTVVETLQSLVCPKHMIVTVGSSGCLAGGKHVPAFTRKVVDTMGAGDAFLAITAPLLSVGVDLQVAALIGNAVGALKVGIPGHSRSVDKTALTQFLKALLK